MGSTEETLAAPGASSGSEEETLERELGIGPGPAAALVRAGHRTPADVRGLAEDVLVGAGLSAEEAQRVRAGRRSSNAVDGQQIVQRWVQSVKKSDRPRRHTVAPAGKSSKEVLKKWVDGDDRAMEAWIQSSEPTVGVAPRPADSAAPASSVPRPGDDGRGSPSVSPGLGGGVGTGGVSPQVLEREETVVRWLTDLLDRVKSDQFDPSTLLQEVQELNRQIFEERTRRKQLEDELEHVKRGSIAVIKYVRSREAKSREQAVQEKEAEIAELKLKLLQAPVSDVSSATPPPIDPVKLEAAVREAEAKAKEEFGAREHSYIERETELRRRIVQLEGEVRNLRSEGDLVQQRSAFKSDESGGAMTQRLKELDQRERDLVLRENELRTKFEEIRISAEELERKTGPIQFKEKELAAWEQRLETTKQALEFEARRLEQMRAQLDAAGPVAASSPEAKKLDDLKSEITRKEEELRAREGLLHQKMVELEELSGKVAESEAERIHKDVVDDVKSEAQRVHSGVRRLDDLLYGGYPPGSQVLVNAPAHTGKEVLARLFVADGLRAGIPAIWVTTDKTFLTIREEMEAILPTYSTMEQKGLVKYVDLYSKSLGVSQADPFVKLLASTDKTVTDQVTSSVNQFSQELKDRHATYRLVFESVSTLTAYLDTASTFRFLQPFCGRRKLDRAVGYYLLETGMHTESDLQTLEHMVDGSIALKIDQLKTFLSVRGITDVQSRAWVGYTFSKKSFSPGSFSLDHIR